MDEMDKKALAVVRYWIGKNLGPGLPDYKEYIVQKTKVFQNVKYKILTDMKDGRFYEVMYSGFHQEWHLIVNVAMASIKFMDITVEAEIMRKVGL